MTIFIGHNTHDLAGSDGGNTNTLSAVKATCSGTGTVQSMSFYVNTASGNINLGLYADSGGEPGALLCQTGNFAAASNQWNTRNTTTNPTVNSGNYWVAFLGLNSALSFPANLSFAANNARFIGSTTTMTDPWPTATDTTSPALYELYATVQEGGTAWSGAGEGDGAGTLVVAPVAQLIGSTIRW